MADAEDPSRVRRLVGVYDADGSLTGELSYWIGARLGRRHCSLCEITHGTFREKAEWRSCRESMPVVFDTVHIDEREPAVRQATDGNVPCVVAVTADGIELLLDAEALEACAGSPERLIQAVEQAATERGLGFGPARSADAGSG